MRRGVSVVGVGLAVAVVVLLSGCHSNPATSPSGPPATSSASASAGPTAAVETACTRDSVRITYQGTDNTAGHFHGVLTFTNTSAASCTMNGYPVAYIGQPEAEETMGAASTDDTTSAPTPVTVPPGGTAHAAVTITDAGNVCDPVDITYLIAAPPLAHPFDLSTDGEHVDGVIAAGCNDASISLIQVGAVTL